MFSKEIGVDLGTANLMVYVKGQGVVLQEPAVVAIDNETGRVHAVGEEARLMIGRTPGNFVAQRPIKDGVIADYVITQTMLKHLITSVYGRNRLFRPRVVVCVPSGVTSVEKRAVIEATMQAGAKHVHIMTETMASAIGAGLNVTEAEGNMIVDVGGGTTDIAVISLGGEVVCDSIRIGGDRFDEDIVRYLRREFNLLVGVMTAEACKIELASVYMPDSSRTMEVAGRDSATGLPMRIEISQLDLYDALHDSVTGIVHLVRSVLERTPPELSADIGDKGMLLTGGGALLPGLARVISEETGIPCHPAEDPLSCVALGTGRFLESDAYVRDMLTAGDRMTSGR